MNILIADIGGTNARFGYKNHRLNQIAFIKTFKCNDFKTIDECINLYLTKCKVNFTHAVFAVAGPCHKDKVEFSNNNWKFSKNKILETFRLKSLLVVNDFVGQALSFSDFFFYKKANITKKILQNFQLIQINKGNDIISSNMLVTGPGTGLGACTLIENNGEIIPIEGEGGNINFAPQNKIEFELLNFYQKQIGYVSFEDVLSGKGLENIYKFLKTKNNYKKSTASAEKIRNEAVKGDYLAKESVKLMLSILGTFVSTIILINNCKNSVILSGGVIEKLYSFIPQSNFFFNLKNKNKYKNFVSEVPIYVSLNHLSGLEGSLKCFNNNYFKKLIIRSKV